MKRFLFLALLFSYTTAFCQKTVLPVSSATSVLRWTGHAEVGAYSPTGTLALKAGSLVLNKGEFAGALLSVDMTSLKQDNADLTHHLKSADFFDVEKYPTATISIDKFEAGNVYGTLTIKGKAQPFHCPVTISGDQHHFRIVGKTQLDRTAYGIVYNSSNFFSGLGNKAIRNTFEVEFDIQGEGALPAKYRT